MVYRVFSAFLTFFLRRDLHFKGRLILQIISQIMKIYSFFGRLILGRLIRCTVYMYIYSQSYAYVCTLYVTLNVMALRLQY